MSFDTNTMFSSKTTDETKASASMTKNLVLDPSHAEAPTRDHQHYPSSLPEAKETKVHPTNAGGENASLYFVGTATTIL
jgi:hypothetical protein